MPTAVTSFYYTQMISTNPSSIVFSFTFANSDLSGRVVEYGTIARTTEDIFGGEFSVTLENASGIFSNMLLLRENIRASCTFEFGFKTATGSNDLMQLFAGDLKSPEFSKDVVELNFGDKLDSFSRKNIGTELEPVSFVNTNVNPADLGWWLVTSYGGLSLVESTSNPDIDYAAWSSYREQFANDSVTVNAYFTGETIAEGLEAIRNITDSVLYAETDNKLIFNRWLGAPSSNETLTDSWMIDVNANLDIDAILNTVDVPFSYAVSTDTWRGISSWVNTSSVTSYGVYSSNYDDNKTVWYTDRAPALTLAERLVFRLRQPVLEIQATVPLPLLNYRLGDNLLITTAAIPGINANFVSLSSYDLDINTATIEMSFREDMTMQGFILDDPIWGLLDNNYNPLIG